MLGKRARVARTKKKQEQTDDYVSLSDALHNELFLQPDEMRGNLLSQALDSIVFLLLSEFPLGRHLFMQPGSYDALQSFVLPTRAVFVPEFDYVDVDYSNEQMVSGLSVLIFAIRGKSFKERIHWVIGSHIVQLMARAAVTQFTEKKLRMFRSSPVPDWLKVCPMERALPHRLLAFIELARGVGGRR